MVKQKKYKIETKNDIEINFSRINWNSINI